MNYFYYYLTDSAGNTTLRFIAKQNNIGNEINDNDMKENTPESPEKLAKWLHDNYEEIAKEKNWNTQSSCKVEFDNLPKANKETMIELAARLIYRESPEKGKPFLTEEDAVVTAATYYNGWPDSYYERKRLEEQFRIGFNAAAEKANVRIAELQEQIELLKQHIEFLKDKSKNQF